MPISPWRCKLNNFSITDLTKDSHIHFVGIGGISMSGLAEIMLRRGYKVTGSDISDNHIIRHLKTIGIKVFIGHGRENAKGADLCVYTAAIKPDNPELIYCEQNSIPAIERAVLLGGIMKLYKNVICVAGTHGKTTTTSMLSSVMLKAGLDPTIMLGGELDLIGGNFRIGKDNYFLTEACEYHSSFLEFSPKIAVITNIEEDHLDYFKDLEHIINTFSKFIRLLPPDGFAVVWGEDETAMAVAKDANCAVYSYGLKKGFDFYPENISNLDGQCHFNVVCPNGIKEHIKINLSGEHNVRNSLATIAVGYAAGIPIDKIAEGLASFNGVKRRFEKRGKFSGAYIYDDYAHHPTEIKATLKMAKDLAEGRVIVAFQPHTYTRTRMLLDEFSSSFDFADKIIITDIYAAREKDDGTIHAKNLAELIAARGKDVSYISSLEDIADTIKEILQPNDIFISMGAGTIYKVTKALV